MNIEGKLVDFDWKVSVCSTYSYSFYFVSCLTRWINFVLFLSLKTTLASDTMSNQYCPTMLLTVYYLDEHKQKCEAYFEFNKDQLHEFIEKLHSIQDVYFCFFFSSFRFLIFPFLLYILSL